MQEQQGHLIPKLSGLPGPKPFSNKKKEIKMENDEKLNDIVSRAAEAIGGKKAFGGWTDGVEKVERVELGEAKGPLKPVQPDSPRRKNLIAHLKKVEDARKNLDLHKGPKAAKKNKSVELGEAGIPGKGPRGIKGAAAAAAAGPKKMPRPKRLSGMIAARQYLTKHGAGTKGGTLKPTAKQLSTALKRGKTPVVDLSGQGRKGPKYYDAGGGKLRKESAEMEEAWGALIGGIARGATRLAGKAGPALAKVGKGVRRGALGAKRSLGQAGRANLRKVIGKRGTAHRAVATEIGAHLAIDKAQQMSAKKEQQRQERQWWNN